MAPAPTDSLVGVWRPLEGGAGRTIRKHGDDAYHVTYETNAAKTDSITRLSKTTLSMVQAKTTYTADIENEGVPGARPKLRWSDGDVWLRDGRCPGVAAEYDAECAKRKQQAMQVLDSRIAEVK